MQRIKNKWLGEQQTFWGLSRKQLATYGFVGVALTGLLLLVGLILIRWLQHRITAATATIAGQNMELQAAYQELTAQNEELIAQGEEVLSSEAKAKALLQAVPDMIIRMSRDGVYREIIIPSGTDWFDIHARRIGQSVYQTIPTELANQLIQSIQIALAAQSMQSIEYDIELDGKPAFRESRIVPMAKDEVMILVRDLTAKRAAERSLADAHQRLRDQHEQLQAHTEELSILYSKLSVSEAALRQKVDELEQSRKKLAASEERFRWRWMRSMT